MAKYTIEDTTITNIADAIRNKNGSTNKYTPTEMPDAIRAIETGGGSNDEWQPESDWWDIDSILENDMEDYEGKIIALIGDELDTTTIYGRNANKIITSDGKVYINTPTNLGVMQNITYTHTWDKTKDKECSMDYKTRYIIWYYSGSLTNAIVVSPSFSENPIYMIVKNFSKFNMQTNGTNPCFYNVSSLVALKGINSYFYQTTLSFLGSTQLQYLDGFDTLDDLTYTINLSATNFKKIPSICYKGNISFAYGGIQNMSMLKEIDDIVISAGNNINALYSLEKAGTINWTSTDLRNLFNMCDELIRVDKLVLPTTVDSYSSNIGTPRSLRYIGEINTIVASGMLNFTNSILLGKDSIIRILNALYDYAAEGSTATYTLTLGTTNLAKLTDEEKAIATNKGWTLA